MALEGARSNTYASNALAPGLQFYTNVSKAPMLGQRIAHRIVPSNHATAASAITDPRRSVLSSPPTAPCYMTGRSRGRRRVYGEFVVKARPWERGVVEGVGTPDTLPAVHGASTRHPGAGRSRTDPPHSSTKGTSSFVEGLERSIVARLNRDRVLRAAISSLRWRRNASGGGGWGLRRTTEETWRSVGGAREGLSVSTQHQPLRRVQRASL